MSAAKTAVIALGGNAITKPGAEDTIARQFANTRISLDGIVDLASEGYNLVVTHGNGPQVGNALLRIELARVTNTLNDPKVEMTSETIAAIPKLLFQASGLDTITLGIGKTVGDAISRALGDGK